jgi:hypothetical protein
LSGFLPLRRPAPAAARDRKKVDSFRFGRTHTPLPEPDGQGLPDAILRETSIVSSSIFKPTAVAPPKADYDDTAKSALSRFPDIPL